jgi:cell division protein FtsW
MLVFGSLMVYSASAVRAASIGQSTFHFFLLQVVWIGLGLIAMYIAYKMPLDMLSRSAMLILLVSIVLLVLVLIIGKNLNGASRWIDLGPFDLQPSEVAKIGFVIYLAAWLSKPRPKLASISEAFKRHFYYDLFPFIIVLGVIGGLIIMQPDLDTAVIISVTALAMYFVSGTDALHTLGSIFILVVGGALGIVAAVAAPYRLSRIQTYIQFLLTGEVQDKRDSGFQLYNGLVAIGSGGLLGIGFGESKQKFHYLQDAAFTDSIFSIIAEEFGLLGSLLVVGMFLLFMYFGIRIALNAKDKFSSLLATGITTWITLQALLNIGANVALFPFGGIPLPFMSYGGSSTLILMIAVGLLLNISAQKIATRV